MPFITNENFLEFVEGKSVALVGPGKLASNIEQGEFIDSHDFVARVKSLYVPLDKRTIYGSRTDFLYTDNDQTNDVLPGDQVAIEGDRQTIIQHPNNVAHRRRILSDEVKVVTSTSPQSEWFFNRFTTALNNMSNLTNVRVLPDEPYMSVRKVTNRPNAGFSAIIDLVSLPFSKIYITGIDFYRSLYRENYLNSLWTKDTVNNMVGSPDGTTPDGTPDFHNPDAQFMFFKNNIYKKDDRVIVDSLFRAFLEDPFYEKIENCLVNK